MLAFQGPAQPSPALGDALNAGFLYLEVKCLGCNTHQTVALNIVRRPKSTPIHELERYMRCQDCSRLQGRPYKRSHLIALRPTKISAEESAVNVVAGGAGLRRVSGSAMTWQRNFEIRERKSPRPAASIR
jgi:hypothetical protein